MSPKPMSQSEGAVDAPSETPVVFHPKDLGPDGRPKPKPEWKRMAFHVLAVSTAAVLCMYVSDPYWRGGLVIFALVMGTLYELVRKLRGTRLGKKLNDIRVRRRELRTRAASTDFIIAMSVCAFVFDPHVAATAFTVTALADPMARIWGIYFGTVRWGRSKKTIEGSIGFFLIAFAVIMLLKPPLPVALVAAVVATCAELRDQRIIMTRLGPLITLSDNFYIPVCTAAVLEAHLRLAV